MKRNLFYTVTTIALLSVVFIACDNEVNVQGVELSQTSAVMQIGDTLLLSATVLPDRATDRSVRWHTNSPDVATVNQDGKVIAIATGRATVTVTTVDGSRRANCNIEVAGFLTKPDSSVLLHVGNSIQLSASAVPSHPLNWSSSDTSIVTVSSGRITGRNLGEATITATTQDGNFTASSKIAVTMPAVGTLCNDRVPGFGISLGIVGFVTDQTWTVGNQIWSDAVAATACNKVDFDGGWIGHQTNGFNADCRSNPGFPGDLFSWCAVVRFASLLCPYPWRVPTMPDFIDLDIALGGTGTHRNDIQFINDNYMNPTVWGGSFNGGIAETDVYFQGERVWYWSQTEMAHGLSARPLHLQSSGMINLGGGFQKGLGGTLRCVRDNN